MSLTEADGGGEDWLKHELGELAAPVVSEGAQPFAEVSLPLGLTYEDYMQEPETKLADLVGSDLGVLVEGADRLTHWQATHVYKGKLVVHETFRTRHVARWMVAGSVYVPATTMGLLGPQEYAGLCNGPWEQRSTTGVTTTEHEAPAMIVPGVVCLNAMLSIKRLYTENELRSAESVSKLLNEPTAGYAVALPNGGDKMPSVYFMDDEACLTSPVVAMGRLVKNKYFSILGQLH